MIAAAAPVDTAPPSWSYLGAAALGLLVLAAAVLVLVVVVELVTRAVDHRRPLVIRHTPAARSSATGHARIVRPGRDTSQEGDPQ